MQLSSRLLAVRLSRCLRRSPNFWSAWHMQDERAPVRLPPAHADDPNAQAMAQVAGSCEALLRPSDMATRRLPHGVVPASLKPSGEAHPLRHVVRMRAVATA